MRGVVVVDLNEFVSLMYQDCPNGSSHTHKRKGTTTNCTLWIHTSNINHIQHMKIVVPCIVSIIATNSTQWIYVAVYKVR